MKAGKKFFFEKNRKRTPGANQKTFFILRGFENRKTQPVMAGLDPAIHAFAANADE
jgi:hypothetical protein